MRARATATDHVTRLSSHLASNCPLPDIQQLPSCASLCCVLIVIALMWQEMSSRAEILARAREAKKEKKDKKSEGPWGGCVLARVERCKKRHSIALHAMALPVEVIQLVCMLAAQPGKQGCFFLLPRGRSRCNKLAVGRPRRRMTAGVAAMTTGRVCARRG